MNIIDTLTAAFTTVVKKIWLFIIPLALDFLFWLGPKVSAAPLVKELFVEVQRAIAEAGTAATTSSSALISEGLLEVQASFESLNLMSLLAWGRIGVPSVAGLLPIREMDMVFYVRSTLQMLGVGLVLLALGLMIACILIGLISQAVKAERFNLGEVLRRAPTHWLNLAVIYLPLTIFMGMALSLSFALGPLAFIIWVGILWISLYLFFVPQAVIMSDASPIEALRNSFIVVRMSFWRSLGFVILVNLISGGFGLIWARLVSVPVGIVAAIVLNAFIGTGLMAASCYYYRDRLAKWHQLVNQLRTKA